MYLCKLIIFESVHKTTATRHSHKNYFTFNSRDFMSKLQKIAMAKAMKNTCELQHDKTNKMICEPSEDSDQPGHPRPGWSESSLSAQWVAKDPRFLNADSKDSNQTGRMPRLIWVFTGCTGHFVGFVMPWLISARLKFYEPSLLQ